MEEFKRVFNIKIIILMIILLIANITLFTYSQLSGRSFDEMNKDNEYYAGLLSKYEDIDISDAIELIKEERVNAGDFSKTAKLMQEKLKYIAGYEESIDNILNNAKSMQKFSLFSKKDSFSYNNIIKTASDFLRVSDISLKLDNDRATDAFVNYYYLYYIAAGFMVVLIYAMFTERDNGMWPIVHNTSHGRCVMAVKRALIMVVSSFVMLLMLYGSTVICSLLIYGGWDSLGNPIQTIIGFGSFSFPLSKMQYLVSLFFISWLIVACLSLIVWMLFTVFRNRNHTLILIAVFTCAEILLYQKIEIQSVLSALHHINIVSFLKINELYCGYLNWGFNTFVFSVLGIIIVFISIFAIVSVALAVYKSGRMRPFGRTSKIAAFFAKLQTRYQRIFSRYCIVLKEMHKLIFTSKGLWVVVCVIAVSIYFSTTGTMTFTDSQKEKDSTYLSDGGEDYTLISEKINSTKASYKKANEELEAASQSYKAGDIDIKKFYSYESEVQYWKLELANLTEYINKEQYINRIKEETGEDAWMISDRGYEEIFGQYSNQREIILLLSLVIGIMFIVSESISLEYRTGMKYIVNSSAKGRCWINARKIAACIIFTLLLTAVVYGIDMICMKNMYGMPYLKAPLISLTYMEETAKNLGTAMTIGGWIWLRMTVRIVIMLITMTAAMIVSKFIGKKGNRAVTLAVMVVIISIIILFRQTCGVI